MEGVGVLREGVMGGMRTRIVRLGRGDVVQDDVGATRGGRRRRASSRASGRRGCVLGIEMCRQIGVGIGI